MHALQPLTARLTELQFEDHFPCKPKTDDPNRHTL